LPQFGRLSLNPKLILALSHKQHNDGFSTLGTVPLTALRITKSLLISWSAISAIT